MLRKLAYPVVFGFVLLFGMTAAQAVTIDLSSDQAGTEVSPGDTVEMTITVTNDTEIKDCIVVTLKLVVDGIKHPVTARGYIRLKLEAGESVTRTVALAVPEDLELTETLPATLDATASGKKTETTDSASFDLTLVPLE